MRGFILFLALMPLAGFGQHCCMSPAFLCKDWVRPYPQDSIGNASVELQYVNDSCEFYFNQGLNLYHAFNFNEAFGNFKYAYELDTNCYTCALFMYMILEENNEYEHEEYEKSLKQVRNAFYGDSLFHDFTYALAEYEIIAYDYKKKYIPTVRAKALEKFQGIEEPDIMSIYMLVKDEGISPSGEPEASTKELLKVADSIMGAHPDNTSILHYYIHLYEDIKPHKVLDPAIRLAQLAPNSGHLVHMLGHAYYFNGMYSEAADAFIKAFYVDSTHNASDKAMRAMNWNYVHNMHFLLIALTEAGRFEEVKHWENKLLKASFFGYEDAMIDAYSLALSSTFHAEWRTQNYSKAAKKAAEIAEVYLQDQPMFKYYFDGMSKYLTLMNAIHLDKSDSLSVFHDALKSHLKLAKKVIKEEGYKGKPDDFGVTSDIEIFAEFADFLVENYDELQSDWKEDFAEMKLRFFDVLSTDPPRMGRYPEEEMAMILEKYGAYQEAIDVLISMQYGPTQSGLLFLELARLFAKAQQITNSVQCLDNFYDRWESADSSRVEFEKARVIKERISK